MSETPTTQNSNNKTQPNNNRQSNNQQSNNQQSNNQQSNSQQNNNASCTSTKPNKDGDTTSGEETLFFTQLAKCTSIEQLKKRIHLTVQQLGLSDYSYSILGALQVKNLTTLGDQWQRRYLTESYSHYDLILEHAASDNTPLFLSTLESYINQCPFASRIMDHNIAQIDALAHLGFKDSYSIPLTFHNSSQRVVFTVFAKGMSRDEFQRLVALRKPILSLLAEAITYFGATSFSKYFLNRDNPDEYLLTPKPQQLLLAIAIDGLMLKEAAEKLCISVDTANKHIATIKKVLGATTLANAVYLAMIQGIIHRDSTKGEKHENE